MKINLDLFFARFHLLSAALFQLRYYLCHKPYKLNMKKLLTLFFLLSTIRVTAQIIDEKALADAKKAIDQYKKQDTVLAGMLVNYGAMLIRTNPEEAIMYTDRGENLSRKLNWKRGLISCLRQKGVINHQQSKYAQAISYQFKALKAFEGMNGLSMQTQQSFRAATYLNIAMSYSALKQYNQSTMSIKKSIGFAKKANVPDILVMGYLNAGSGYIDMHKPDSSLIYLDSAYSLSKKNQFNHFIPVCYLNMGLANTQKKQFKSAISLFDKVEQSPNLDNVTLMNLLQAKGEAYFYLREYNRAKEYLVRANNMAKVLGTPIREAENSQMFSDIYQNTGDYKLALEHYKQYILLRGRTIGEGKKVEAGKAKIQFEADKKQALADEEIKYQKNIRNYSIVGIGILLAAGIASFIFYKKHRDSVQKQNELLYKAQAAENEMRILRLQMNPHFIFNSLNSISDYINKNDIEKADYYLTKFAKLMRSILENSEEKEILLAEEIKMTEAYMQLEASRLKNKFAYKIDIANDVDIENVYIPPLIMQPFIENSIWHGFSNKENGENSISISQRNNILQCVIEDNGSGRKGVSDNKKSYGIKITADRLALHKGPKSNIEIFDLPQGTRVEINLPFEKTS
ncbi:tetratricopeptide repeat-containing sensor histidine kinase [Pedobacter sp.]